MTKLETLIPSPTVRTTGFAVLLCLATAGLVTAGNTPAATMAIAALATIGITGGASSPDSSSGRVAAKHR